MQYMQYRNQAENYDWLVAKTMQIFWWLKFYKLNSMQNCKFEMQSILRYVHTLYILHCKLYMRGKISLNGTDVNWTCQLMEGHLK